MPEGETKPRKRTTKKKGKKTRKQLVYEDKKQKVKLDVKRQASTGEKLAAELMRQQFATLQAERQKAEEEKRQQKAEEKEQAERLRREQKERDDLRRAELEKFQKSTEPTLDTILQLYRTLNQDPESFKTERGRLRTNVTDFSEVLLDLGMNPEKARVKATEASLLDLVERRKAEAKKAEQEEQAMTRTDFLDLKRYGWSDAQAKELSQILSRRRTAIKATRKSGAVMTSVKEMQEFRAFLEREYKKLNWTPDEIEAKIRMVVSSKDAGEADLVKPTHAQIAKYIYKGEEKYDPTEKKPKTGEEESPISSSTSSVSMEEEPAPETQAIVPFEPVMFPNAAEWGKAWQSSEYKIPPAFPFPPAPPPVDPEFEQYWATRGTTEPEFAKEVKELLKGHPAKLNEQYLQQIPNIPPPETSVPLVGGGMERGGGSMEFDEGLRRRPGKGTSKQTEVMTPTTTVTPRRMPTQTEIAASLQPVMPPYKEPAYKPPGEFEYLEGLNVYDPSRAPTGFTRQELVPYKPKEKIITPHEETAVKKPRVEEQLLPPAFVGGGMERGGGGMERGVGGGSGSPSQETVRFEEDFPVIGNVLRFFSS